MGSQCRECGSPITQTVRADGRSTARRREFCSAACKANFKNRRMLRGAELYDFYMAGRYQRDKYPGILATVNQMCAGWRDEDKRIRNGRRSWNDISRSSR